MSSSVENVESILKASFQSARRKASPALPAGAKAYKKFSLPSE
jgi:hypothetical protein